MIRFQEAYRPITSRPFLSGHLYKEYLPCSALRPYIACYWHTGRAREPVFESGGTHMVEAREVRVIPDACMDIIISINHTTQKITGFLCSMQDEPFISTLNTSGDDIEVFAIRFYFWSVHLFLKLDFKYLKNQNLDLDELGGEWRQLFEFFFYISSMDARIEYVAHFLRGKLDDSRQTVAFLNAVYCLVSGRGKSSVKEICEYGCVSQRQMERQFLQAVGLPMKRVSNLIRYQNVWSDIILSDKFNIQDAVYRYGYTDQSHLLREFKRFHGTAPDAARQIAYLNR